MRKKCRGETRGQGEKKCQGTMEKEDGGKRRREGIAAGRRRAEEPSFVERGKVN